MSSDPSPSTASSGDGASALDLTLCALRPLLASPDVTGAMYQSSNGGVPGDSRRVATRSAAVCGFRMVQSIGQVDREFYPATYRCLGPAAFGVLAVGRTSADRHAAGDNGGMCRNRDSAPRGASVEHRGIGAARNLPSHPTGKSKARRHRGGDAAYARFVAVRGLHAPCCAKPQEYPGVGSDRIWETRTPGICRDSTGRQRGDLVLNPFDKRSLKWDLFSEIKNPHDVDQLARSLIPDHEGQDRSWRSYARTFFTAVTRQAHEAGVREVDELYRLLVAGDTGELRELVRGTPAQPFLDEHNSRMFDSIRSVTSSAVAALEYVGRQDAPGFSIKEWVSKKTPGVLFIPYKAGQIAALHSTISAWMRLAIFEAMDGEEQQEEKLRDPGSSSMVRGRRIGCPGPNRRIEGRTRTFEEIRWSVRPWFSIDRASLQHVRPG